MHTVSDGIKKYREYTLSTFGIIEQKRKFTALEFACESALISGEDPAFIPWPSTIAQLKAEAEKKGEKWDEPSWVSDFRINDLLIAESCLWQGEPRKDIVAPVIINMS
jgi:hypothetical protein